MGGTKIVGGDQTGGRLLGLVILFLFALSGPAAARTAAGGAITNIATLRYMQGDQVTEISSNTVSTRVDEQLDVSLVADVLRDPAAIAAPFILTNQGNGREAFALTASVDGQALFPAAIIFDRDSNGLYDPAIDTPVENAVTAMLAPGQALHLLVLPGLSSGGQDRVVRLTAAAVSGHGAQGSLFPGQGDSGVDALAGPTTASATAQVTLPVERAEVELRKSQQVTAPDGGSTPVSGALIAYRLEVIAQSAGLSAARLSDLIPAGTDYVAGSLQIDGSPLSDTDDSDPGNFDGAAIHVAMGDLSSTTTRVVTFQVKIQ